MGVQNEIRRHPKARGPVCVLFMACPILQAPIQERNDHLMAPKCHSKHTQSLRKAATETRFVTLEQGTQWNNYDSALSQ